jgi:pimeloyl-ACP methyl ester carboxylesterase
MKGDSLYMNLSALAYEEPEYVNRKAPYFGYVVGGFISHGPAQAYLFKGQRRAIVAIRGTEASSLDVRDLLSNIRVHAREWEGPGKAHLGYVRQYRLIHQGLMDTFSQVSTGVPLDVTGHSMGGAIATIAAAYATGVKGWNFNRLVTFGSPACLDAEGHEAIEAPHTRYVNKGDWAQCWPPSFTIDHGVEPTMVSSGWGLKRHVPSVYLKAMKNYEESFIA